MVKLRKLELYSNDRKVYLGKLTSDKFDANSVFNTFGTYGSSFSADSIWNKFGTYGSEFSSVSAFNDFSSKPPVIMFNGEIIGYLTTNSIGFANSISPHELLKWLEDNGL